MTDSDIFKPKRPLWLRVLNALGTNRQIGWLPPKTDEETLVKKAIQMTGLRDFGDERIREALKMLVASQQQTPLNFFGRCWFRDEIIRRLSNRLWVQEAISKHPGILEIPIKRPVFILGLPRTGTTVLQRLFMEDATNRILKTIDCYLPVKPSSGTKEAEKAIKQGYVLFDKVVPNFRSIHDMGPQLPEECINLNANDLISIFFVISMKLTEYAEWIGEQDLTFAYQCHKRQLQLLQSGSEFDRWVLKAPAHIYGLEWLLKVYPDAVILWLHRDPSEAVPSMASLMQHWRSIGFDEISLSAIGEETLTFLEVWVARGMKARSKAEADPSCQAVFLDVHYRDLVSDPVAIIQNVYKALGLELSGSVKEKMHSYLVRKPQNKYGKHNYSLEKFGLNREQIGERFNEYIKRFDIGVK